MIEKTNDCPKNETVIALTFADMLEEAFESVCINSTVEGEADIVYGNPENPFIIKVDSIGHCTCSDGSVINGEDYIDGLMQALLKATVETIQYDMKTKLNQRLLKKAN